MGAYSFKFSDSEGYREMDPTKEKILRFVLKDLTPRITFEESTESDVDLGEVSELSPWSWTPTIAYASDSYLSDGTEVWTLRTGTQHHISSRLDQSPKRG
jgi:hypothetical protein